MFRKSAFRKNFVQFAIAPLVAFFAFCSGALADDPVTEIPVEFRGTWILRLTSDDQGKTYKSGDGMPICEVTAKEVKFARKVPYSDEKLVVKSVKKKEAAGKLSYVVTFENSKLWTLSQNGASLTALIQENKDDVLTETYRITVRTK